MSYNKLTMAGHSKWNNIKNRKGAADTKRAKVFAELAKHIRIAVKEGKSDKPDFNPTLRLALEKARAANMPKENIMRAIDRGMGRGPGGMVHEVTYEGFGPHGVAVMVYAATNNPVRTSGEVRHAFTKYGGSLGGPGSAHYMFERTEAGLVPLMPAELTPEQRETVEEMIALLEENDDVEEVVTTLPPQPEVEDAS